MCVMPKTCRWRDIALTHLAGMSQNQPKLLTSEANTHTTKQQTPPQPSNSTNSSQQMQPQDCKPTGHKKPSFPRKLEAPVGSPGTCSLGRLGLHRWAPTAALVSSVCWILPAPAPAPSHPLWPPPLVNPRPTNPVIKRLPIRCPVVSCSQVVCVWDTARHSVSSTTQSRHSPALFYQECTRGECHMLPAIRRRHALHRLRNAEHECPPPRHSRWVGTVRHATPAHIQAHARDNMGASRVLYE